MIPEYKPLINLISKIRTMKKIIFPFLLLISLSGFSQDNNLTVIGNKNAVPAQLTYSELQGIFLGNKPQWSNGGKVIIAMMKLNTPSGKATCDKLFRMTPDQVTKHWLGVSIKGTIDAPVFLNSAAEVQSFVSANSGAIGIINEVASAANTKTVLIDGKKTF